MNNKWRQMLILGDSERGNGSLVGFPGMLPGRSGTAVSRVEAELFCYSFLSAGQKRLLSPFLRAETSSTACWLCWEALVPSLWKSTWREPGRSSVKCWVAKFKTKLRFCNLRRKPANTEMIGLAYLQCVEALLEVKGNVLLAHLMPSLMFS